MDFALNPRLDPKAFATDFAASGRLHIPAFLDPDCAEAFHRQLRERQDWSLIVNQGERSFDLDRAAQAAMTAEQRAALDEAVHAGARYGFQYRYEAIRVPDETEARAASADPVLAFAAFLSSPSVVEFLRQVTGKTGIDFADAQATAYGPGHFLTAHDDAIEGKNRHAAYVFNLTHNWRADWGGLLLFHGDDGHVERAFTPSFNALNLFAVPQPHSVSLVAPFAANRRYSVTGWLRGR